jgi:hypothetical protein
MAKIGYGYGSECHLLRWMGRHRKAFDKTMLNTVGTSSNEKEIEWLDFGFSKEVRKWFDAELKGLEFIDNKDIVSDWRNKWPTTGEQPNWDAVGLLTSTKDSIDEQEIVLVEAKAHTREVHSHCQAESLVSIKKITDTFKETAEDLNCKFDEEVWMQTYYQLANRLAIYNFLKRKNLNPHLVLLYFVGDMVGKKQDCPTDASGWMNALAKQDKAMGIEHLYETEQIHKLFLHVSDDKYCWASNDKSFELRFNVKDMVKK